MEPAIRVRFFAGAGEAVGAASLAWSVPTAGVRVDDLLRDLVGKYPRLGPIVRHSRFLVNSEYVDPTRSRVGPGDEFAVHPPYSGG